jgi:hypothetical protein
MADGSLDDLGLSDTVLKSLRDAGIDTLPPLRDALANGTKIPGVAEKRLQEIRKKLAEYDGRAEKAGRIEPRFFLVGIVLLAAAFGLACWGFSKPSLARHQILIMQWLLPLASGFCAGAFTGGLTFRSRGWLPGVLVTATGGFAVWIITFFQLGRSDPPPDRTVLVQLRENGSTIKRDFVLTYEDESGVKHSAQGRFGEATINLPGNARTLRNVHAKLPCYQESAHGPFDLIEGRPISLDLVKTVRPMRPPLLPSAFPDPATVIPRAQMPTTAQLNKPPVIDDPGNVVLEYKNVGYEFIHLLLFSFDSDRKANPWRVLPCDPCVDGHTFNGLTEKTGWFALIGRKGNGECFFLGCVDLYSKNKTEVTIATENSRLTASIR